MQKLTVFRLLLVWYCIPGLCMAEERPSEIEILQPGVNLTLVAEHPALATPTGLDVDAQGRIWVVATHT
ncbi:MAG: hypothetical protein KDB01_07530, partial [Planctomycetaceae bacterium]|nr:hypothetical protein [Planctomycetaceae bacterium]